jgi:hypothetical protein
MSLYDAIEAPKLETSLESSELIKYAANAYLAMRLSFTNDIANLAEATNANVDEVLFIATTDPNYVPPPNGVYYIGVYGYGGANATLHEVEAGGSQVRILAFAKGKQVAKPTADGAVITIGLIGSFAFGVGLQNISAGAYLQTLTLVTGLPEVVISIAKALAFGLIAGLVGCYRGLTVGGGAKGVGIAVNETLVLCVVALFAVNVIFTTIGVRFGTGR